jgi:hypothetical protein
VKTEQSLITIKSLTVSTLEPNYHLICCSNGLSPLIKLVDQIKMKIFCIGRLFRISLEYAEIGSEVGLNRACHVLDILPPWTTRVRTWRSCPERARRCCRVPYSLPRVPWTWVTGRGRDRAPHLPLASHALACFPLALWPIHGR